MTDFEKLVTILEKHLTNVGHYESLPIPYLKRKEFVTYNKGGRECITIGEGSGYSSFAVDFDFEEGVLVEHAVYE